MFVGLSDKLEEFALSDIYSQINSKLFIYALILSIMTCTNYLREIKFLFFILSAIFLIIINSFQSNNNRQSYSQQKTSKLEMAGGGQFNPLTRRKNTRIRWFEPDLQQFYSFVENQPLLTREQELKYGKALYMWITVEKLRKKLLDPADLIVEANSNTTTKMTDIEFAESLGCSMNTLKTMKKYSEISKIKLINGNMKLVLAVVSRYRTSDISNAELIAEGTRGLSRAVLRYDYSKGFRFATYAMWYVHQAVADYVRIRKNPTKMPSRYLVLQRRIKAYMKQYEIDNNQLTPTIQQISVNLNLSAYDVEKVLKMNSYPQLLSQPVQVKTSRNEPKDQFIDEILPSIAKTPILASHNNEMCSKMENMMSFHLNDIERDILRLRLGLDDGHVRHLKEIGKKYKISWNQVRTVEKSALSKLSDSNEINDFMVSFHTSV